MGSMFDEGAPQPDPETPVEQNKSGKKPKAPKAVKEVDPNAPVKVRAAPVRRIPANDASVIHVSQEKVDKYKGQRKQYADFLKEGQTIAEFKAAGGDNGFLRFFVNDGAVTFTEVAPVPKPAKEPKAPKAEAAPTA